ncbi:hypothetical protein BJY04DRAFT_106712 [Aspergillus karnatakaensis]|uniref:uncharacterized protein n=1 Tax=Aspergillus karnatakaensis TaxID=1810916 RepID=UPI003CCD1F96
MVQEQLLATPKLTLEELPAEIIQEIFLRCVDINLPRASIHLARALSNPIIYRWLLRLSFSKAWCRATDHGGTEFFTRHFLPPHAIVGTLTPDELTHLRTRILECRWCTLPLIRSVQAEFLQQVFTYKRTDMIVLPKDRLLIAEFEKWFNNLDSCDKASNGKRGRGDLRLRANRWDHRFDKSIPESAHDYNVTVWFDPGIIEITPNAGGSCRVEGKDAFEFPACDNTLLPNRLLRAPWTQGQLDFLRLLSTKALLDIDVNYDRASRTLRSLIHRRDFATFARLLDLYVLIQGNKSPVIWPSPNAVFRTALRYAGDDDPFVRLLVEERWTHIHPEDLVLKERLLTKMLSWGRL